VFRDDPIRPWLADLRARVDGGVEIFDVHTHVGQNDPDGFSCTPEELIEALEGGDARAAVFAMHEPDGYPPANDFAIEAARASGGRLVPFGRLDPAAEPLAEAERTLAAGALGLKLHPRAENFALDHPALAPVYALADERRLPIIVHAGRGIPALGRHAVDICAAHPNLRLILAHAGICDLAWIWRAAGEHPNLFFDTAWWSAVDLITLFSLVPPGQILFASDAPYGTPTYGAMLGLRYAMQVGLEPDQIRSVMGGQVERLLANEDPLDLGPPPGPDAARTHPLLDRAHSYLATAVGQMFNGLDAGEMIALAELACEVGDDSPHAPVCRGMLRLLHMIEHAQPDPKRPSTQHAGLPMVVMASVFAKTPDVPLPEALTAPREDADVGERARGED
jgi:uncharacterized protein